MNKDGESSKKILFFVSMLFMLSFGLITVGYINSGKKTDEFVSVLVDDNIQKHIIFNVNNKLLDTDVDHSQQDLLTEESNVGSEKVVPERFESTNSSSSVVGHSGKVYTKTLVSGDKKKLISSKDDLVKVVDYELAINDIFKYLPIKKELVGDFKNIKSLLEKRGRKKLKIIDREIVIKKSTIEYFVEIIENMKFEMIRILDSTTDDITFDKIMNIELLFVKMFDCRDKIYADLESYDGKKDINDKIDNIKSKLADYMDLYSEKVYDRMKQIICIYMNYLFIYLDRHIFNMTVKHEMVSYKKKMNKSKNNNTELIKTSRNIIDKYNDTYSKENYFGIMDGFKTIESTNLNKKYLDEFMTKLKEDKELFLDGYNKLVNIEKECKEKYNISEIEKKIIVHFKESIGEKNDGIFKDNIKKNDIKNIDLFIGLLDVFDKLYYKDSISILIDNEKIILFFKVEDFYLDIVYKFRVMNIKVKFSEFVDKIYSENVELHKIKKVIDNKLNLIKIEKYLIKYKDNLRNYLKINLKRNIEDSELDRLADFVNNDIYQSSLTSIKNL